MAPGPAIVAVSSIQRGKSPDVALTGCGQTSSSCDGFGTIKLDVGAQDDQTPTDKLSYQFEVVAGKSPPELLLPTEAVRAPTGTIFLHWSDGASDDREAIDFSIAIRVVDLAGNVGSPSTVEIHDPGSGGCSILVRRSIAAWPMTVMAILLLARMLRRLRVRA